MARLLASHGQWRPLVLLLEEALSAVGRKGKVALVWNVAQVITCPFHFLARRPKTSKPGKQAILRHSHSLCLYKGGGRGPLRIPEPPPACPSLPSSAGIGGRGAAGQLLRRLGAPSFLHKLSVQPAQFIPLNRARIFFAGTVTALPLPYAGDHLRALWPLHGTWLVTQQVLRACLSLQECTLTTSPLCSPTFLGFPWFGDSVFPRPPELVALPWFSQG